MPDLSLHGHGGHVAWGRCQFAQGPASSLLGISIKVEELGWLAWSQRDLKLVQGPNQSFPACFDKRLLAGPAVEECLVLPAGGERTEHSILPSRKEACVDLINFSNRVDVCE